MPLSFDAHYGAVRTNTYASTVTFDLKLSDKHIVTMTGNPTLALSNDQDGQVFMLLLKQDGTGGRTVTWFANIKWVGGVTPTLTATPNKTDVFNFVRVSSTEYLGFAAGLNL